MTKEREALDLTKRELGAHSDTHPVRIGQIENQRVRPYAVEMLRIAAALGWTGDWTGLLEEVDDERTRD